MSAKKVRTPKEKLIGLLACGSGKKNQPVSNFEVAPLQNTEDEGPIDSSVVEVRAYKGHAYRHEEENENDLIDLAYTDLKLIGKGTFGVVYRARLCDTGELVAIKKVFDDKRYKNRELVFMRRLQHPNVCDLRYYFYSEDPGCRKGERFLNMVLEYVPQTLFTIAKCDGTFTRPFLDPAYIKVYIYQLLRSLNYLHSMSICHRDIKPQNMLINPQTHEVKLCDFGSAKELLKNESNVSYICSRYYRAPELIFGAKDYTYRIDLWSAGCILGELYLGHPIFPGSSGPDQMVEIMKILGTPTYEDMRAINPKKDMVFPPTLVPMPWSKVFTKNIPSQDAVNLMARLLVFNPEKRIVSLEALAHPFFQELRNRNFKLPDGKSPPHLFDFTSEELENSPTTKETLQAFDWEKETEEDFQNNFSRTPTSAQGDNLKSKIVNFARNSFRKASFRRDRSDHSPHDFELPQGHHFEDSEGEMGGYGDREESYGVYDPKGGDEVEENFNEDMQNLDIQDQIVEENEEKPKKKKKKKKAKSDDQEEHTAYYDENIDANEEVKVKKKKKKKQINEDEIDDEAVEAGINDSTEISPGGGKKKKKNRTVEYEEEIVEQVVTKKKSSSRKKPKEVEINPYEEDNEPEIEIAVQNVVKKKKKKKPTPSYENEV